MDITSTREIAVEAVKAASRLCEQVAERAGGPGMVSKEDKSPVTIADFGSQAAVIYKLRDAFPDSPVVGEEDASALRKHENAEIRDRVVSHVRGILPNITENEVLEAIDYGVYEGGPRGTFWTLDPIDGTKGFLRGDQYAVALGLISDGRVIFGVLGCPRLSRAGSQDSAGRGALLVTDDRGGAVASDLETGESESVSVTSIRNPTEASFCESVESAHSAHGVSAQIADALGVTAEPHRIDSQCKYAAIARGDASIYLRMPTRKDYEEKIWDHAAGAVIVENAGGKVSDIHGKPLDFSLGRTLKNNQGVVATNGHLHDQVIAAIQSVLS
jgi:3'(2'), 5'-bisphosphate nucleotidase